MTEKIDFYGIRDIMNETLNEKKTFVPRHGDKESLDNITAQLNEAKMHPCVFLNNHAIGIEAAGDFMKLLNSGEEQYSDNDMVDKDLLKNVYNTLKKIYKDEGKKLKESTMFESILKEGGIEVYPEDGKLKARNIGQQVVSSRTQNKLNPLGTKDIAKPLTPTQKAATSAVLSILNDKGRAGDINSEFDTDPRPDITLMANGDAVITPDGQNNSYKIPASEIDAHMRESILGEYDANGEFHGKTEEDIAKEFLESVDLERIVEPKDKKVTIACAFIAGMRLDVWESTDINFVEEKITNGMIPHSIMYYGNTVGEYYTFYEGKDMPIEEAIKKAFVDGVKCDGYIDVTKRLKQLGYTNA